MGATPGGPGAEPSPAKRRRLHSSSEVSRGSDPSGARLGATLSRSWDCSGSAAAPPAAVAATGWQAQLAASGCAPQLLLARDAETVHAPAALVLASAVATASAPEKPASALAALASSSGLEMRGGAGFSARASGSRTVRGRRITRGASGCAGDPARSGGSGSGAAAVGRSSDGANAGASAASFGWAPAGLAGHAPGTSGERSRLSAGGSTLKAAAAGAAAIGVGVATAPAAASEAAAAPRRAAKQRQSAATGALEASSSSSSSAPAPAGSVSGPSHGAATAAGAGGHSEAHGGAAVTRAGPIAHPPSGWQAALVEAVHGRPVSAGSTLGLLQRVARLLPGLSAADVSLQSTLNALRPYADGLGTVDNDCGMTVHVWRIKAEAWALLGMHPRTLTLKPRARSTMTDNGNFF